MDAEEKKLQHVEPIKRCILWKRAPMDKDENIPDRSTQEVVDHIVSELD